MKDFQTPSNWWLGVEVSEVTDPDWCSTAGDTALMCNLKRTTVQYIFKVGVQALGKYSVWRRNFEYNT